MTDRTETTIARGAPTRYVMFEVTMTTSDTVTIDDLTNIQDAALFSLSDGLEDTATTSGNVITLTQTSITNQRYVGIATGV